MWFVHRLNFFSIILKHLILCEKKTLTVEMNANESLCQRCEQTQIVVSSVILELS